MTGEKSQNYLDSAKAAIENVYVLVSTGQMSQEKFKLIIASLTGARMRATDIWDLEEKMIFECNILDQQFLDLTESIVPDIVLD